MNYRHLQFFVSVVDRGSIKAAASQLGVSQPAISAAIRNLEQHFGARLLDRRHDGSVPTVYGQTVYESAITMGKVADNARLSIAALKDPTRRQLRIGTGPSVSTEHVAVAVSETTAVHPELRVEHITGESLEDFERKLMVRDIDIALCHVPSGRLPSALACELITNNPIGALVATAHLRRGQKTMSRDDMVNTFRWITSRDDEIRRPQGVPAPSNPEESRIVFSLIAEDLQLIKFLTLKTRSIGFLPLHMAEPELKAGELVQLTARGSESLRPIYALSRPGTESSPVMALFLKSLLAIFQTSASRRKPYRTIEVCN